MVSIFITVGQVDQGIYHLSNAVAIHTTSTKPKEIFKRKIYPAIFLSNWSTHQIWSNKKYIKYYVKTQKVLIKI